MTARVPHRCDEWCNVNPHERIWLGEDDIPTRYAAGVGAGITAAYDGRWPNSTETSPAWHRGFKAGWHSVHKVIGYPVGA